jgi:hypothetical protein
VPAPPASDASRDPALEGRLGPALGELDPSTRALLDLSLRFGVSDAELADFLRCDPQRVASRREQAVAQLGLACRRVRTAGPRRRLERVLQGLAVVHLVMLLAAVVAYKAAFIEMLSVDTALFTYGLVVCGYIMSRFLLSLVYRPAPDRGHEPTVAIVMPSFNEEGAIAHSLRSLLAVDYPHHKLEPRASGPPTPKSSPSWTLTRCSTRWRCAGSSRASPILRWAPSAATRTF